MGGQIVSIKKVTIAFLTMVLVGCSSKLELDIEFDVSCFNKGYANTAYLKVTQIGGGYASGEVSIDIMNGYTLTLPENGDYRIEMYIKDPIFNTEAFGMYWDETQQIKWPGFVYRAECP